MTFPFSFSSLCGNLFIGVLTSWVALAGVTGLRVHIGVAVVGLVRGHDTLYRHGLTHRRVRKYGPLKEKINIGALMVYA